VLWYGYIYYILALFSLFGFTFFVVKVAYTGSLNYKKIIKNCFFLFFTFFLFLTLVILTTLYYTLDLYSTFNYLTSTVGLFNYLENSASRYLLDIKLLNISLVSIYSFPFIYIFIFITILSLLFCLAYNNNELITFSAYIVVILLAGYVLFFTDSVILFFFSYETLLIPSFFILYNFAKTRRCVEAAYLMFF